jgi:AhpD family alkylhydroperoxidase
MTPRIEPLAANDWPAEMGDALAAMVPAGHPRSLTGDPRRQGTNIMGTFAHHPVLAKAFFTLNGHLLRATTLTPRQRELIVMRVAALQHCTYEWVQHVFVARGAGLGDLEIAWIAWGPTAPGWDECEASLLLAVDELARDGVITDSTWAALTKHLETRQILDVIVTAGAYTTIAWLMQSVGIELDDDLLTDNSE